MSQHLWYIIRQSNGTCQISSQASTKTMTQSSTYQKKHWGVYETKEEAVAKKIGLIRSGQCLPE